MSERNGQKHTFGCDDATDSAARRRACSCDAYATTRSGTLTFCAAEVLGLPSADGVLQNRNRRCSRFAPEDTRSSHIFKLLTAAVQCSVLAGLRKARNDVSVCTTPVAYLTRAHECSELHSDFIHMCISEICSRPSHADVS